MSAVMTPDEFDAITETIRDHQYGDPALIPDCFQHALDTLRTIALCPPDGFSAEGFSPEVAREALRRMVLRAVSGVPFDEPPHTLEHL